MATNKYPKNCALCGVRVEAEQGIRKPPAQAGGEWIVEHLPGQCPDIAPHFSDEPLPKKTVTQAKSTAIDFPPTAEQQAIVDLFLTGESMVIVAGAGAGKTSTLRLLAKAAPTKSMQYLAFGKDIAKDVQGTMPPNVKAANVHKLAYASVCAGTPFGDRLGKGARMTSTEVARRLGLQTWRYELLDYGEDIENPPQRLQRAIPAWKLASMVMTTVSNFCKTADEIPTRRHVGRVENLDLPDANGEPVYDNQNALAEYLEPFAQKMWRDLESPWGTLPFKHDHYLKLWQLSHPKLDVDVMLVDEAQDLNPVMFAIVQEQTHTQRVYVGDPSQAIFEFTGAVDAISAMIKTGMAVRQLTTSFRFGPAVADAANTILAELGTDLRLSGFEKIESTVGRFEGTPDAILTRTNATAITELIVAKQRGERAHLVLSGDEMIRFVRAADELMATGSTGHPELSCFTSWMEVKRYVKEEEQGAELKLNVDLIDRFGVDTILDALENMPKEQDADFVVSTAHKSKGRQWKRVRIANDFVKETKDGDVQPPTPAELRLQYVAVTRAQIALDHSALVRSRAE